MISHNTSLVHNMGIFTDPYVYHVHTYTCTHVHRHARTQACMCTCLHRCMHTCTGKHTHTHTHAQTITRSCASTYIVHNPLVCTSPRFTVIHWFHWWRWLYSHWNIWITVKRGLVHTKGSWLVYLATYRTLHTVRMYTYVCILLRVYSYLIHSVNECTTVQQHLSDEDVAIASSNMEGTFPML